MGGMLRSRFRRVRSFTSHASLLTASLLLLAACGSQPPRAVEGGGVPPVAPPAERKPSAKPTTPAPYVLKKGGGFYKDDGPGDAPPPEEMEAVPDAVPRSEPLHKFANNPYSVLGRDYVPLRSAEGYKVRGIASWYGRKFHGQKTSSGEPYDMFGMTAAHTTLPIPSYARVTNPANGKSVVVRVNDRGPFHVDRVIDLSYTAAWKLGLVANGSGTVVVESVKPGDTVPPVEADPIEQFARQQVRESVAATTAAPPPAAAADVRGTFIQLGAFGNPDNAESFRNHMARELDALGDMLRTEIAGKLYRVQLGPFASRGEAEAAVARIVAMLGVKPTIVVR